MTNFRLFLPERNCRSMTIFNLIKMAENSPKRIENTEGKGEIARYEQFLLFRLCFRKTWTADSARYMKQGFFWERVNEILG